MNCEKCHAEHDGSYGRGRFCSSTCARSFSTTNKRSEINQKVSKKLLGGISPKRGIRTTPEFKTAACVQCQKEFETKTHQGRICCSLECRKARIQLGARASAQSQKENRRSKNEIHFATLCQERFQNVKMNEPLFNGWDADVILLDQKIAVMWNGKWHYEKLTEKHSVLQVQTRDAIKASEIEKAGFRLYVIKDLGGEDKNFVEEQFRLFVSSL